MKVVSAIFKKYSFFMVLGLFAAVFVLDVKATLKEYIAGPASADFRVVTMMNKIRSLSLGDLVEGINKADPNRGLIQVYTNEMENRITKMLKEFSQTLLDYREWAESPVEINFISFFKRPSMKQRPIMEYPQYDELKELKEDVSKKILQILLKRESLIDSLNRLRSLLMISTISEDSNLADFLDSIKEAMNDRINRWIKSAEANYKADTSFRGIFTRDPQRDKKSINIYQ